MLERSAREQEESCCDELLGVAHDLFDARERAVPLENRELGVVTPAGFALSKDVAQLKDARQAAREEPLHLVFGRRDEVPARRFDRVEMQVETRGGDELRRVDLEEVAGREEGPRGGECFGTAAEVLSDALYLESVLLVAARSPGAMTLDEPDGDELAPLTMH